MQTVEYLRLVFAGCSCRCARCCVQLLGSMLMVCLPELQCFEYVKLFSQVAASPLFGIPNVSMYINKSRLCIELLLIVCFQLFFETVVFQVVSWLWPHHVLKDELEQVILHICELFASVVKSWQFTDAMHVKAAGQLCEAASRYVHFRLTVGRKGAFIKLKSLQCVWASLNILQWQHMFIHTPCICICLSFCWWRFQLMSDSYWNALTSLMWKVFVIMFQTLRCLCLVTAVSFVLCCVLCGRGCVLCVCECVCTSHRIHVFRTFVMSSFGCSSRCASIFSFVCGSQRYSALFLFCSIYLLSDKCKATNRNSLFCNTVGRLFGGEGRHAFISCWWLVWLVGWWVCRVCIGRSCYVLFIG